MPDPPKIAVLGIDGFIGSYFFRWLQKQGLNCVGTSRRRDHIDQKTIFLDLLDRSTWDDLLALKPDIAIALFAVSKLQQCDSDPQALQINAVAIPELLACLSAQDCRTVFTSTNSVFGGQRELCNEADPVEPGISYAKQKVAAEEQLGELIAQNSQPRTENFAIVRLTRTISPHIPPFSEWIHDLREGADIEAFEDFIFAPISLPYACEALLAIGTSHHSGIFHLSGKDLNYFQFAQILAEQLQSPSRILPTTSSEKGLSILFLPKFSAIGMKRTTELIGLRPQSPEEVVRDLTEPQSQTESIPPTAGK